MKNFGQGVLVFFIFFLAAVAVLEIDRQCREVTGNGGDITASTEFIVEKVRDLG